jgi:branched-chain amino acid transport system ATP-binding protein
VGAPQQSDLALARALSSSASTGVAAIGRGGLVARGLVVRLGGVQAVDGVDLHFEQGEILGLIGPNGAGKTTIVNALSGFQRLDGGRVELDGRDTTRWSPDRLARHGLVRTFQGIRLFGSMTALENVEAAALGAGARRAAASRRAAETLELLGLGARADRRADTLAHGDARRLGIARALALRPRLLMLDEPAAGLNEAESDALLDVLARIRGELGCGLLVIEHDMRLIMRLCDRVQVLDHGATIAMGDPLAVQGDPAVLEAYLGSRWNADRARR